MSKPFELLRQFNELVPDNGLLKELYKRQQAEYLRQRLKAIEMLWSGQTRQEVVAELGISYSSLLRWVKVLVKEGVTAGLKSLARPYEATRLSKLSEKQQAELLDLLEHHSPTEYGYSQHIFTGAILVEWVKEQWGVSLSDQAIYDLLHRHHYSYQKAHRDYENADPAEQERYATELREKLSSRPESEKIVSFDEFSVSNRPTPFYGWARVNTKFSLPSDEKKTATVEWLIGGGYGDGAGVAQTGR